METYHRKRSKNAIKALANTEEMLRIRRQLESSSRDGAKAPQPLASVPAAALVLQSHSHSHSHCTTTTSLHTNDDESSDQHHDIELGSVYQIDHTNLPPRTPVHLRSIRVVMVSEKTELNVSVRFPSNESLRTYFSDRIREMYPALDEKFVMGIKLAGKVLYRQVPSQEFAEKKHSEGFWLVNQSYVGGSGDIVATRKDMGLTTELKSNGMVRWGIRRQVMFLGKHSESINTDLSNSSSFVKGVSEAKEGEVKKIQVENYGNEEEEEDEEEEEEEEKVNKKTNELNLKRKRYSFRNTVQKAKKVKREKERQVHKAKTKKCKHIVLRDPTDRWSKERYKLAEKNLLDVMKEKGAAIGHPILRPELRLEARKRIGDTGLLDHLLKHMAGKVAPGGEERFRRRHNATGAMEYWLESADLAKIRVEAGVEDPFWIPPPGWKPGDCPTQDPICAKELKLLKEETCNIKENIEEMVSKKKFEEELAKLRREMEEIASKKNQEETQAIVVSEDPGLISSKMNLSTTTFVPSATQLDNAVPREKYKQQLMDISDFLKKIEAWIHGEMGKVTSLLEGETKSGSELIVSRTTTTEPCAEKEMEGQAAEKSKEVILLKGYDELEGRERNSQQGSADQKQANSEKTAAAEEKAAKIQRLKSGFRICKPQGTFLWPSMVNNPNSNPTTSTNNSTVSPQVVVQVEDLFVVPTPPSVSSSTATAPPQLPYHHHQHNPASPVKPLAERRAVTVTVSSTISKGPPQSYDDGGNNYTTTTTTTTTTDGNKTTTLINLNDISTGHANEGFYVNPSSQQTITTTTVMPSLMPSTEVKRERMSSGCSPWAMYVNGGCGSISSEPRNIMRIGHRKRQDQRRSSSVASSASCLSNTGGTTWLALATPDFSASDDSSHG